jgi:hypothetical protein
VHPPPLPRSPRVRLRPQQRGCPCPAADAPAAGPSCPGRVANQVRPSKDVKGCPSGSARNQDARRYVGVRSRHWEADDGFDDRSTEVGVRTQAGRGSHGRAESRRHALPRARHVLRSGVRPHLGHRRAPHPVPRTGGGRVRPPRVHEPAVHPGRVLTGARRHLPGMAALRPRGPPSDASRCGAYPPPGGASCSSASLPSTTWARP